MKEPDDGNVVREVRQIHETLWITTGAGRRGLIATVDLIDERTARTERRVDNVFRFLVAIFTPVLVAFILTLVYMVAQQMGRNLERPPASIAPSRIESDERAPLPAYQPAPPEVGGVGG